MRIDSDLGRFKDIIKGKVKSNMKKFASSEHMIGQQGAKTIKIPLNNIDLPRFTFGGKNGGAGSGLGDEGDPMPGQGKGKGKGNKAGEGEEEHGLEAEFSKDELAQIMMEHLELPNLENKGKGSAATEKNKYNQINRVGNDGLRHFKRSYKEALKRQISTGMYDPVHPMVIPQRGDFRYKSFSTDPKPDIRAVAIFMMDVSGSMGESQKKLVKALTFWIDLILSYNYKDIDTRFVIHDSGAKEVSREDFFKISTGGGTAISSAYALCAEMMEKEYPFSENNVYPFHFSDGDNLSNHDDEKCNTLLKERLLPNCNVFSYGQVKSDNGSGGFIENMIAKFGNTEKVSVAQVNGEDEILKTIKTFFEKGK